MIRILLHVAVYYAAEHFAYQAGFAHPWIAGVATVVILHILGGLLFRRRWYRRHRWM